MKLDVTDRKSQRSRPMSRTIFTIWILAAGFVVAGCEKKEEPKPADALKQAAADSVGQATDVAVITVLEKADAFDGKVDKTVFKCAKCNLGMDGKPENVIVYSGYTLQFCSPGCKKEFEADVKKAVMAMNIPAKK